MFIPRDIEYIIYKYFHYFIFKDILKKIPQAAFAKYMKSQKLPKTKYNIGGNTLTLLLLK